jgi:DNA replication protein DnaC
MTAKAKVGERLPYLLSALKAPRIAERLAATAERAREEQWPYEQFLETLCEAEVFAREASGARTRTRTAGFPAHKTLEDFDFTAQPSAERPLVMHLAQLAWVEEHANVCLIGPPGTGKSHLAIALGIKACQHATGSRSPPPNNGSRAWRKPKSATPWTKSSVGLSATSC